MNYTPLKNQSRRKIKLLSHVIFILTGTNLTFQRNLFFNFQPHGIYIYIKVVIRSIVCEVAMMVVLHIYIYGHIVKQTTKLISGVSHDGGPFDARPHNVHLMTLSAQNAIYIVYI